ncbi:copper oxidase [Micromonospora rosaria]|uniref:Multicopper oxidase CueO n=1 Tax=Micromonospora rosaria TaxID=47874 RepID=A0A136PZN1_9ACTN|nr:multicopper oxidase family protein [Micromonospora rosaria]KXK63837.1 copper oxidase [Micromonospora rosaria]
MRINRRRLLQLTGLSALGIPLAAVSAGCSSDVTGSVLKSKADVPDPFRVALTLPPVLKPVRRTDSADYYEITARAASVGILPNLRTPIWGYNGSFPGPTIVSRSGRRTVIRHTNRLPVPLVVHLHGGRTPPADDGYPLDLVIPEGGSAGGGPHAGHGDTSTGSREYDYPLEQRASTLWYHDHRMDFTGPQVWRGLAGFHLVHDDEEESLPLPSGDRDVPLMICDRSFDRDGSLMYPSVDDSLMGDHGVDNDYHEGVLGDVILVNGRPWPVMEVAAARYRLRLLNASNARRYELALDPAPDGPSFVQIGSDGGLLGAPRSLDTLPIAQSERYDVVVDFGKFKPGTTVDLVNRIDDGKLGKVMRFAVTETVRDESRIPDRLSDMSEFDALDPADAVATRKIAFGRGGKQNGHETWVINGKLFSPDFSVAEPKLGTSEIWEFNTDAHHPVHVHLVHFKILGRSGTGGPALLPTDGGWKDTVDLRGGENVRVLARFGPYKGKYVMHCHNLEHEDMAMMANFVVR